MSAWIVSGASSAQPLDAASAVASASCCLPAAEKFGLSLPFSRTVDEMMIELLITT